MPMHRYLWPAEAIHESGQNDKGMDNNSENSEAVDVNDRVDDDDY